MSLIKITIRFSTKACLPACLLLEVEAVVQQTSGVGGTLFNDVTL